MDSESGHAVGLDDISAPKTERAYHTKSWQDCESESYWSKRV